MAQISAIQMLRAAAALTVVVGHAQTEAMVAAAAGGLGFSSSNLLPWGAGVDLFFVISGFIMVVSSERLFAAPGGARIFLRRRLTRILPLWWLCASLYLALQILAHRSTGKPLPPTADIGAAYLLWPTDVFGDGVPRPFYTLGWTLEYEMAFYALFALAVLLPRGRAVLAATLALGVAVGFGALIPPTAAPLVLVTRPIVLEFALGMGLALLYRRGLRLPGVARLALCAAALAALSYDGMASATQPSNWITPNDLVRVFAWGVPAGLLVAAAALGQRAQGAETGVIARTSIALGDASYALYLTHPFVVGTLRRAWSALHLDTRLGWGASVPIALLLACGVGLVVHYGLERSLGAALRRRAGPGRAGRRKPGRGGMSRILAALRSGDWLTPARLQVYPALMLGLASLAILGLAAGSHGLLDAWGRPLGTDFGQIWVAGREIAAGHAAAVYDNHAHALAQEAVFGPSDSFYNWPYPPYFLFVAALCGLIPYLPALVVWQAATLPLYIGAVRKILAGTGLPQGAILVAAAAFPAVTINLLHGHNGFLTAGLLAWGLIVLPRRPLLAGALFALLAYKPQFALALPVALIAGGAWRSLAAAAVSFVALTAATLATFGIEPWRPFWAGTGFTRTIVLEAGATGFEKIQTMFAAVRLVGGSVALAYGAQTLVTLCVLASLAWLWRTCRTPAVCGAALLTATLLTTPYALDYDEVVLGPAVALMVAHGLKAGFAPYEKTILALAWAMPLFARSLGGLGLPLGPFVTLLLYGCIVARGTAEQHPRLNGGRLLIVNNSQLA